MNKRNIIVFAVLISVCLLANFNRAHAAEGERRTLDQSYPLAKDGQVFIDTFKGSIAVSTWDKNEVNIHVEIEADGTAKEDRAKVAGTEIRFTNSPTSVRIKSDYDKVQSNFSLSRLFEDNSGSLPFVHYTITMPATAKLKIKDYKSDTRIGNLHAALELETYKGTVIVNGFEGGVDLQTYKGDVDFSFAKVGGRSRIESPKGKIKVGIPAAAAFEINTDFGRRVQYSSEFQVDSGKRRNSEAGNGTVNGGGPLIRLISEKGDVRVVKN